jgi:protein-S-isoprenylcysteine O-methyltransferase Ste14
VGLFLVLLGAAILSGAWLMIVMVLVVALIYHLQILEEEKACSSLYGESYLRYLRQVPRYFYWF